MGCEPVIEDVVPIIILLPIRMLWLVFPISAAHSSVLALYAFRHLVSSYRRRTFFKLLSIHLLHDESIILLHAFSCFYYSVFLMFWANWVQFVVVRIKGLCHFAPGFSIIQHGTLAIFTDFDIFHWPLIIATNRWFLIAFCSDIYLFHFWRPFQLFLRKKHLLALHLRKAFVLKIHVSNYNEAFYGTILFQVLFVQDRAFNRTLHRLILLSQHLHLSLLFSFSLFFNHDLVFLYQFHFSLFFK